MKELLKAIAEGMKDLESFPRRYKDLEAENLALQAKIEKLAAAVAGGAGKSVEQLGVARERFAQMPAALEALKQEHRDAVASLHNDLANLYPAICELYSNVHAEIVDETEALLRKFGMPARTVGTITRQIANESTQIIKLDRLRSIFSGVNIPGVRLSQDVEQGRARFALSELADYLK
jgi:predicted  nucleic acid-binding Zn-ribbon protein